MFLGDGVTRWDMELLTINTEHTEVVDDFLPHTFLVDRFHPTAMCKLWPPEAPTTVLLPVPALRGRGHGPHIVQPHAPAPLVDDGHGEEDDGNRGGDSVGERDEAPLAVEDGKEPDGDCGGWGGFPDPSPGDAGVLEGAVQDALLAEGWTIESADEGEEEEGDLDGEDPGPHAGPAPAAGPPLPPPAADPLAGPAAVMAYGAHRDRRAAFPKMMHSLWQGRESYLRLSETFGCTWKDMRGVCKRHDTCTLSVSCRKKRPIGKIWAWLNYSLDPSCRTKEDHKGYMPSYEERCAARNEFLHLEGNEDWLEAEYGGPAGDAEEGEPLEV